MKRTDGRESLEAVRAIHVVTNVLANCHSSACVEIGQTRVLCGVCPPQQLVQEYRGTRGRVSCQVHRTSATSSNLDNSRDGDMALALEGVAEQVVLLERIPQLLVEVLIEVLHDDGAVWDAATTALCTALTAGGVEIYDTFSACSAALRHDGTIVVDPTQEEAAMMMANVVVCSGLSLGGVYYCCHQGACEVTTMGQLVQAAMKGLQKLLLHRSTADQMKARSGADDTAGAPTMTESRILQECRKHQGYWTPELNEKIYLHHLGFSDLRGLSAFTGCVVLYLDHNALSDLSGLAALTRLDSLYLSSNALSRLDSLPYLPTLRTLDVAENQIVTLNSLDGAAPHLQTLLAGHNKLQRLDGVQRLSCLISLDVSYNRIEDEEKTSGCLRSHRATLRTLLLHGNGLCRLTPHYRKRWITLFTALRFLDEYPVFDDERARAEAFVVGGAAAEAEVREAQRARQATEKQEQFAFYSDMRESQREARRRSGAATLPTAYFIANTTSCQAAAVQDVEGESIYIPATRSSVVHQDPLREPEA